MVGQGSKVGWYGLLGDTKHVAGPRCLLGLGGEFQNITDTRHSNYSNMILRHKYFIDRLE